MTQNISCTIKCYLFSEEAKARKESRVKWLPPEARGPEFWSLSRTVKSCARWLTPVIPGRGRGRQGIPRACWTVILAKLLSSRQWEILSQKIRRTVTGKYTSVSLKPPPPPTPVHACTHMNTHIKSEVDNCNEEKQYMLWTSIIKEYSSQPRLPCVPQPFFVSYVHLGTCFSLFLMVLHM